MNTDGERGLRLLPVLVLVGLALLAKPGEWVPRVVDVAEATDLPDEGAQGAFGGSALAAGSPGGTGTAFFAVHTDMAASCTDSGEHFAWNVPQGSSIVVKLRTCVQGLAPPSLPDGDAGDFCRLRLYWDNSATTIATVFDAPTCPADGSTFTIHPTSDGTATGTPRAGTVRLRVEANQANEVGQNYQADSDTVQKGALRFGASISSIVHGGYPAGVTHAYTVAGEAMTFTVTHTAPDAAQGTRNVRFATVQAGGTCTTSTAIETATVALETDGGTVRSFTVGDTYPAAATTIGLRLDSIGDATLTATDWMFFQGANACGAVTTANHDKALRADFVNVDARITAVHLLNLNDNTFASPPGSEDDCCVRLTSDLAYFATRLQNARGEGLAGASVQVTHSLRDENGLGTADTCSAQGIATQGGEAGWTAYCTWDESLPAGIWLKTVDVTAPATIDSNAHLVGSPFLYTLAGVNPDLVGTLMYELRQRIGLQLTFFVTSASDGSLLPLDESPVPGVVVTRIEDGVVEYLDDAGAWQPFQSVADRRELEDQGNGFWTYMFARGDVDDWGDGDFTITAAGFVNGAPVDDVKQAVNLDGALNTMALEVQTSFDSWLPDAVAWLGVAAYIILTRRVKDKTLRVALSVASLVVLLFPLASATKAVLSVVVVFVIALDIIATWPGESTKGRN